MGQPVTAVVPAEDGQTLLVTTLDSHLRLIDMTTGKMLNDFTGHANTSYRCRGCFGQAEATVCVVTRMVWYGPGICLMQRHFNHAPRRRHITKSLHGLNITPPTQK
jgi:hypothetical protein